MIWHLLHNFRNYCWTIVEIHLFIPKTIVYLHTEQYNKPSVILSLKALVILLPSFQEKQFKQRLFFSLKNNVNAPSLGIYRMYIMWYFAANKCISVKIYWEINLSCILNRQWCLYCSINYPLNWYHMKVTDLQNEWFLCWYNLSLTKIDPMCLNRSKKISLYDYSY